MEDRMTKPLFECTGTVMMVTGGFLDRAVYPTHHAEVRSSAEPVGGCSGLAIGLCINAC
jgi:hypothetical protein